jgi:hypothetical protein
MPEQSDPKRTAFRSQRTMSKRRGIPFVFTFEDMAGVVGDAVKTLAQLAARTFCPCLGQRTPL